MFSGLESPMHWLVVIVIVIALIVLGPKRLPELGRSLGGGIRGFKDAIEGKEKAPSEELATAEPASAEPEAATVTAQAKPDPR